MKTAETVKTVRDCWPNSVGTVETVQSVETEETARLYIDYT